MRHINNVDWHAVDRCNLQCVSCGHFCSILDNTSNEFDKSVRNAELDFRVLYNITNKGEYLDHLTITGGECTLNENLPNILDVAYKYFPNKIYLFSNCLNMDLYTPELISRLRNYNITVKFSLYTPKMTEKARKFFIKNNISHISIGRNYVENIENEWFRYFLSTKPINNEQVNNNTYCYSKFNCCELKNQKLYVCQYTANINHFKHKWPEEYKKLNISDENTYCIDLRTSTYEEVINYIENYNGDICKHCVDKYCLHLNKNDKRSQQWRHSKGNIDEYLIDDVHNL